MKSNCTRCLIVFLWVFSINYTLRLPCFSFVLGSLLGHWNYGLSYTVAYFYSLSGHWNGFIPLAFLTPIAISPIHRFLWWVSSFSFWVIDVVSIKCPVFDKLITGEEWSYLQIRRKWSYMVALIHCFTIVFVCKWFFSLCRSYDYVGFSCMQNGTRMGSGNGYLIHLLIHSFVWITLSEDGNGIKKNFKGKWNSTYKWDFNSSLSKGCFDS